MLDPIGVCVAVGGRGIGRGGCGRWRAGRCQDRVQVCVLSVWFALCRDFLLGKSGYSICGKYQQDMQNRGYFKTHSSAFCASLSWNT